MTLRELKEGQTARILSVGGEGALRQHFLDMGVIPGAEATLIQFAPMGDPMEIRIHGYELTLRLADAQEIEAELVQEVRPAGIKAKKQIQNQPHPGYGEGGIYHDKKTEKALPEGTMLTFALAGNQNCGKTTLFNQLTGANQHVGNFPGVTVDRKSGSIKEHPKTEVTDLPGIYSMSPYTNEEIVSRQFILNEKPKGIINIVDATNIERNLYLTLQLLELDIPMVVALNMMDEMQGNGGSVLVNEMEQYLGVPVVPISAAKNEGIHELIDHAIHVAKYQEKPMRQDFCSPEDHDGAVHRAIHAVMHLIEDHAKSADIPVRFAATKLIEGDTHILKALRLDTNEQELLEHIVLQMEKERGLDRSAAIADMRFDYIEKAVATTVVKPRESKEHERSRKIDKILTGKYTAIPSFVGIMAVVFYLTFNLIGGNLQRLVEMGIAAFTEITEKAFAAANVNEVIRSLVIDGVYNGVGTVLTALPLIITLFFFLSLLEDSGYMARIAFVMDKTMRKIGLSGRSIVPMLMGFGCSVPAIMSTRTLPSERDRKMTVMLIPFMSCTAKIPVYTFFAAAFFPKHTALVMIVLYFGGILVSILTATIAKKTTFKGKAVPFVMELPNYRLPGVKNVFQLLWEKTKDFLKKAFTIIYIATIVVWFLQSFDFRMRLVSDINESMLATVAGWIAPVFAPLGFGDWRISTALITGFMAKESVVSTLSVLYGTIGILQTALTTRSAAALLTFCLLYTPCVAAITSVKRELGGKWAAFIVVFQCVVAWIAAFGVYLAGALF